MNTRKIIKKYFAARREKDVHYNGYPFVTISRQAGTGGHALAEALLKAMEPLQYIDLFREWMVFDKELCEEVANEPDLHVTVKDLLSETYHSEIEEIVNELFGIHSEQYTVHKRMAQLERALASVGKVVLVGHGANMATRQMPQGIHIRLTAPRDMRVRNMMNLLSLDEAEATRFVNKHDRDRTLFMRDLFSRDINDPTLYDHVYDTAETPIEHIAAELLERVREKGKAIGFL